ncbi:F-box only protein 7 [Chamberlinius hualienensis]
MKLMIKVEGTVVRFTLEIDNEETSLEHLHDLVSVEIIKNSPELSGSSFELSLNGETPIQANECTTLTEAGIVAGDIIRVLTDTDLTKAVQELAKQIHTVVTKHNILPSSSHDEITERLPDSGGSFINRYMNGPILCREATENQLPCNLIREYSRSKVISLADALIVAIKVLMSEEGFKFKGDSLMKSDGKTWWLQYMYPHLNDAVCTLMCVPMGETLIVHGKYREKLMLRKFIIEKYIKANPQDHSDPTLIYRHLPSLSRHVKNVIVLPLLQTIHAENGVEYTKCLPSLPEEILFQILRLLDHHSLLRMSLVSKQFYKLAKDNLIWKGLFYRDFKTIGDAKWQKFKDHNTEGFWESAYEQAYSAKLSTDRRRLYHSVAIGTTDRYVPQPWSPLFLRGRNYDTIDGIFDHLFYSQGII